MTKLTKTEVLARIYEIFSTKEDMDSLEEFISQRTIDREFRGIDRSLLETKIIEESIK